MTLAKEVTEVGFAEQEEFEDVDRFLLALVRYFADKRSPVYSHIQYLKGRDTLPVDMESADLRQVCHTAVTQCDGIERLAKGEPKFVSLFAAVLRDMELASTIENPQEKNEFSSDVLQHWQKKLVADFRPAKIPEPAIETATAEAAFFRPRASASDEQGSVDIDKFIKLLSAKSQTSGAMKHHLNDYFRWICKTAITKCDGMKRLEHDDGDFIATFYHIMQKIKQDKGASGHDSFRTPTQKYWQRHLVATFEPSNTIKTTLV